jgi:hypothetical protein
MANSGIARLVGVDAQRDLLGHRAARHEQRGFAAEQRAIFASNAATSGPRRSDPAHGRSPCTIRRRR